MNKFNVEEKINKWITGILITIFIGYFIEAIMGIVIFIKVGTLEEKDTKTKGVIILSTFIAFMIILSLFIILSLYIIKDNYEINELNKKLILIGIPIILGYYLFIPIFKNLYIGSLLKNKQNKQNNFNCNLGQASFKFKFSIDIGIYNIFTNFFNLTLLISIFYSIYWNNWDISSLKKWLICIGSILGFNLVVFSISLALIYWNLKQIGECSKKKFSMYNILKKFCEIFKIKCTRQQKHRKRQQIQRFSNSNSNNDLSIQQTQKNNNNNNKL